MCSIDEAGPTPALGVRAILDVSSQRSYVTTCVRKALGVMMSRSESVIIKTFGSEQGEQRVCDIVQLKNACESLVLSIVVVLHTYDPVHNLSTHLKLYMSTFQDWSWQIRQTP